uniref:phosphoethanolamine N-methyltransferase n=1 Tax=Meloidogyne floridensis TaxID=298350 RepID=A0A915NUL4_9BILA
MSALSCELAYALQNHPNSPKNGETEMDIGELINISERLDKEDNDNEEENLETRFDAAICSNLFIGQGIVNDRHRIAQVLGLLLRLIRTDGVVIIRENLKQWGSRSIADLTKFLDVFAFRKQQNNQKQQQTLGFNFYGMSQVQDSIYAHSNFLDVFWSLTTAIEYTEDNVASYEWIFGTDFISPGGVNENRRVLKYFRHLRPGQQMLDIGVGIGGGARQAAREFGLQVLGCDLSSNMIQHAFDRNQRDKDHRVEYQIADAMVYRYEANAFDIVFSRDCIQHIKDTKRLFRNIYTWLKPGGQVLVTMYGKGHGVLSPKFHEYVRKRQYALKTLEEYREIAHSVGLTNIYTENMTKRLREILVIERDRAVENKEEFIQKFSEKLYSKLIEGWADKLQFIDEDNQNWLLLRAEKPVHPHAYLTEAGA